MDMKQIGALFEQRRAEHTLPQALYTDADIFDFDMAAIYGQSWLMVGMECELPKTGSYISMMVGKWPVLITRDSKGIIRAFHNSCRHRGSMICALGSGTAPKLVCPYHRWTYDLNGSLFGLVTVWFRSLEIIYLTQGDGSCRSSIQKISS
jgi:glycine betaine catabolism A